MIIYLKEDGRMFWGHIEKYSLGRWGHLLQHNQKTSVYRKHYRVMLADVFVETESIETEVIKKNRV